MTAGREVGDTGAVAGSPYAPPDDTGEALGLSPSRLTLTVGFGPGLFETPREGPASGWTASARPRWPSCRTSSATRCVRPGRGGDICIQACADDPQVAVHAIRNLTRIGFGAGRHREHQCRGHRRADRLGLGRARRRTRLAGRRLVPRGAYDDADADSGISWQRVLSQGHPAPGVHTPCGHRHVPPPLRLAHPDQQALAASDVMNEYIQHVGSTVFACPPGVDAAGWRGQSLFA